jgi:predicted CoA-binding protein
MSAHTSDPIYDMFVKYKTIAVVGLSAKFDRPSYRVAKFLQEQGYRIIPVTPTYDEVLGEKAYPRLLDVPPSQPVEIVDIFRRPEHVPEIVDQSIEIGAKVVWMQLGIIHESAAAKARSHGLQVVMDKCTKPEFTNRFLSPQV